MFTTSRNTATHDNAGSFLENQPAAKRSANESIQEMYLNEIHKIPMLDRETEFETAKRAYNGDERARDLLVRSNLRFVVTTARKYTCTGLSLMDLINEGNIGLINAAKRFNPEQGYHFISYAVWWIKQAILLAIQQKSSMIRLPVNRAAALRRIKQAQGTLDNQMAANNTLALSSAIGMSTRDIDHLMNVGRDYVSLDSLIGGTDLTLGANIMDPSEANKEFDDTDLKEEIRNSLSNLKPSEREVIQFRFGLECNPMLSLEAIGMRLNLSKERIRQIEKHAIRKIRTGASKRKLRAFMN